MWHSTTRTEWRTWETTGHVSMTSVQRQIVEQIILSVIIQNVQEICAGSCPACMGLGKSDHHWSTWSPSMTAIHLAHGGKAVGVYLHLSKAFDSVSHSILLGNLAPHGLDVCVGCWIKNCLDVWAQRVVVNGTTFSWQLVTSGAPPGLSTRACVIYLSMTWMRGPSPL